VSISDDIFVTLRHVADALESLGVEWAVGGSFASSAHGEPRATNDIDVVAALSAAHVAPLIAALRSRFHCDEAVILDAIRRRSSFNLIDEHSFVKVDLFVPPAGPMGEGQLIRRQRYHPAGSALLYVLSAEDVLLQKLRWFELGNRVSERQWRDIVSLLRIAGGRLDFQYIADVAEQARLGELLQTARREAAADTR
jgi:hypothetical protein